MNTFIFIDPVQGFMFFNKDKFQRSKWAKLHDKDYHPKIDRIVEDRFINLDIFYKTVDFSLSHMKQLSVNRYGRIMN